MRQLMPQHTPQSLTLFAQVLYRHAHHAVVQTTGPVTDAGRIAEVLLAIQHHGDRPTFALDRRDAKQRDVLSVRVFQQRQQARIRSQQVTARTIIRERKVRRMIGPHVALCIQTTTPLLTPRRNLGAFRRQLDGAGQVSDRELQLRDHTQIARMRPTPQRFGQVVTQHGLTRCGD